MENKNEAVEKM